MKRPQRHHVIAAGLAGAVLASGAAEIVLARHSGSAPAASCHSVNGLPDHSCTPGAVNPKVTQANIGSTICLSGWTATIRPPASYTNALKAKQIRAYGYSDTRAADYEEDHLVALEIGGDPRSERNLWPEPRYGPHPASAKDALENRLHREVCSGAISLASAQRAIAGDWLKA